jgi:uncharacterized protein with HEPN domain
MSIRPELELLRHIQEEPRFLLEQTRQITKEAFLADEVLCRAAIRSLEIIGEASKKLSPEFKATHPDIPWKKIAGTRDKLIHDYYGIDYEIVLDIIRTRIDALHTFAQGQLSE